MTFYQKIPPLDKIVVHVRYICTTCNRVYKKQKTDMKFHDRKKHAKSDVVSFRRRITINNLDVTYFDPRDLVTLRTKGILRIPEGTDLTLND